MSDAQREHASAVEHIVPGLTALRANIHSYLEDDQFWMIYFILLLPRLNEHDFEILSTPQARVLFLYFFLIILLLLLLLLLFTTLMYSYVILFLQNCCVYCVVKAYEQSAIG